MGIVKARGCSFYYEEQGEGPPILLIPPAGSTASTWGTLPGDLAGTAQVIAEAIRLSEARPNAGLPPGEVRGALGQWRTPGR